MVAAGIMVTDIVRLSASATVGEAVGLLGADDGLDRLAVVDDDERFIGFVSYGLLFTGLTSGSAAAGPSELGGFMANIGEMGDRAIGPLVVEASRSVAPEASMMEVAERFTEGPGPLAVTDNSGRLLGVITPGAAFKSLWKFRVKS